MAANAGPITVQEIGAQLVAGIRFRGEYDEAPKRLQQLRQQIQPHIAGPAMLLHYYFDQSVDPGHDLEVCFPVDRPLPAKAINGDLDIHSWLLPGARALCATHTSLHGPRDEAGSLTAAWQQLFAYVRQHGVIVDAVPRREVYLEANQEHGSDEARYVTEVQLPYTFLRVERLAENLDRYAGPQVRRQVMAGAEDYAGLNLSEKAAWFRGAMARLDALVDDEDTRRKILITCADQFPRTRIRLLREQYQRDGDLDALLATMRADRTLGDLSWYEQPTREGGVIHVTKDPVLPEAYREATTEAEKRAAYCHCRLLSEAILEGLAPSGTYCYCGAGWYKQLWEGILDCPVRIDVVRSILQGDDRCSFDIHLPPEAVPSP